MSAPVQMAHRSAVPGLACLAAILLVAACPWGRQATSKLTAAIASLPQPRARTTPAAALAPAPSLSADLQDLISRLPKAELHIHIEGTLEPELMMQLAKRNNVSLPYASLAEAKAARENYSDLQSFLDCYQVGLSVLVTAQDFHELAAAYLETAAAQNITHAEIFFDPQSHMRRGVPLADVVSGLQSAIDAARQHPTRPVDAQLILCLVRELGELAGAAALVSSLPFLASLTALGLASTEVGYPPKDYKGVYQAATLLGLHRVAHAGEEAGPDYVWQAIRDLGAQRIDHGIHSLDDPELVSYMANNSLPITLCPISNQQLKVYGAALPAKLRAMLASGIQVTVNSDDPAYFGAYVNDNYAYLASLAGLGPGQLAALAKNSFAASFISEADKAAAYARIEQALAEWRAEQRARRQGRAQRRPAA